jgi:hypothetical protein
VKLDDAHRLGNLQAATTEHGWSATT